MSASKAASKDLDVDPKVKKEPSTPNGAVKKEANSADTSDSDDDDDVPLAQLKKQAALAPPRRAAAIKKSPAPAPSPAPRKRKADSKPAPAAKKQKAPAPKKPAAKPKTARGKKVVEISIEDKLSTEKGNLVSELMLRWWYVLEWPSAEEVAMELGPDFMKLDGFPGVMMGYKGDHIGEVKDERKETSKPSFNNLYHNHPAAQIKEWLEKAYESQLAELEEHEGDTEAGKDLAKQLNTELKAHRKVNTNKADKEAGY